jgi:transcriptional regulator
MARANTQWQTFAQEQDALVIFQGPHAYISPSWYEAELSVPTWNYAVVHAYGVARLIEDKTVLHSLLQALVETSEARIEKPWALQLLPEEYVQKMMQGIVGFEIPITRLEGKFKLSQNRPVSDQVRVVAALKDNQDELSAGVAALMIDLETRRLGCRSPIYRVPLPD